MILLTTMISYNRLLLLLALLSTPLLLLYAYNGCGGDEALSEGPAAARRPTGGPPDGRPETRTALPLVGGQEQELRAQRQEAVPSPSIPDHPPFMQDFESSVASRPWINDSACRRYEVRLGVDIPPVSLVSFPRSGNTWTRYLVEGATGIFTGSVYTDKYLYKIGYLGEIEKPTSKKVLLIKDHLLSDKHLKADSPVILLIRDPKPAVASYLAFEKGRLEGEANRFTYKGPLDDPHSKDMNKQIRSWISFWEKVATTALGKRTVLVVRYEDIKSDRVRSVRQILSFLKISPDEGRLGCLAKYVEGKVNRGQPEQLPPYTAEQKKLFRSATRRVSNLLKKRGLAPLPYV